MNSPGGSLGSCRRQACRSVLWNDDSVGSRQVGGPDDSPEIVRVFDLIQQNKEGILTLLRSPGKQIFNLAVMKSRRLGDYPLVFSGLRHLVQPLTAEEADRSMLFFGKTKHCLHGSFGRTFQQENLFNRSAGPIGLDHGISSLNPVLVCLPVPEPCAPGALSAGIPVSLLLLIPVLLPAAVFACPGSAESPLPVFGISPLPPVTTSKAAVLRSVCIPVLHIFYIPVLQTLSRKKLFFRSLVFLSFSPCRSMPARNLFPVSTGDFSGFPWACVKKRSKHQFSVSPCGQFDPLSEDLGDPLRLTLQKQIAAESLQRSRMQVLLQ